MPHDNHEIIHSQQANQSPGKLAPNIPVPIVGDITFKNDFGDTAVGLAHFTQDQGIITILTLAGAFIGSAFGGFPMAGAILLAGLNDVRYAGKQDDKAPPVLSTAIQQPTSLSAPESPSIYSSEVQSMPVNYQQVVERPAPVARSVNSDPSLATQSNTKQLIESLRIECPALLGLVKSHPIRAVGIQRSGKTTLVKKLSLLRMILLPQHQVIASTPHYEEDNPYPSVFKTVGIKPNGGRDYPAIAKEWKGMAARVKKSQINSITTIWDEFGLMDQVMSEEDISTVMTSCLRETMKFGEYPIFIVHGETQAFLPGSKGLVTIFKNSTVRVEAIGEKITGQDGLDTVIPTGKFTIQWLDGTKEEGQIPDWLTEEFLLNLVPVSTTPSPEPTAPPPLPDARQGYTDEEKRQAEANMVAALRVTAHSTLWEFARDELGVVSSEEIKNVLAAIADLVFDYELVELKTKFRLSSKNDVRYSYASYRKKIWETHQYTGNICCCCRVKPSEEVHHSRYQGENDKAGVNLYPVCGGRGKNGCHDKLCHSFENWVIDQEDLWGSHATPEWEAKLKEGFELLVQGKQ